MSQYQPGQPGPGGQGYPGVLASLQASADGMAPALDNHQVWAQGQTHSQQQHTVLPSTPATAVSQQAPLGNFSERHADEIPRHAQSAGSLPVHNEQPQQLMQNQAPLGQYQAANAQQQATPAYSPAELPSQATRAQSNAIPAPEGRQTSQTASGAMESPDFQGTAKKLLVDIANVVLFDQQGAVIYSTFQAGLRLHHVGMLVLQACRPLLRDGLCSCVWSGCLPRGGPFHAKACGKMICFAYTDVTRMLVGSTINDRALEMSDWQNSHQGLPH